MLSILICTYNHAKFLEHCLGSVLGKGEIVVVNDCSTDNTSEILNRYKNQIKIITNKERKNLLESRKIAFENSTGDYIVFVDDDDEFLDIEITDADITQGKSDSNDPKMKNWFDNLVYRGNKPLENKKQLDCHVWGKIFKRELVEKVYEILPMSYLFMREDYEFMSRAFELARSYKFVDKYFYKYYRGTGYSTHWNDL